jgi:hypothetical protein
MNGWREHRPSGNPANHYSELSDCNLGAKALLAREVHIGQGHTEKMKPIVAEAATVTPKSRRCIRFQGRVSMKLRKFHNPQSRTADLLAVTLDKAKSRQSLKFATKN